MIKTERRIETTLVSVAFKTLLGIRTNEATAVAVVESVTLGPTTGGYLPPNTPGTRRKVGLNFA